jgi:hypothetical protein
MKDLFLENIKIYEEISKKQECKISADDLPNGTFIYVTKNVYYSDVKPENLIGVDKHLYDVFKEADRKVKLCITDEKTIIDNEYVNAYQTNDDSTELIDYSEREVSPLINYLHLEFDDQCGYDSKFKRLRCVMFVSN